MSRLFRAAPRKAASSRATSAGRCPPSVSVLSSIGIRCPSGGLLRAERRLVGALRGLVGLERLGRVDVAERRVVGTSGSASSTPRRFASVEPSPIDLHVAEAGQRPDPRLEIRSVGCLGPEARGVVRRTRPPRRRTTRARASPCWRGSDGSPAARGTPPRARPEASRRCAPRRGARAAAASSAAPRTPVCTVTCWSSANPIRSASGLSPRRASASASPVKWIGVVVAMPRIAIPPADAWVRSPARDTLIGWTRSLPSRRQTRAWFERAFAAPTPAQEAAWPVIATGAHVLVQAPTGSGKTLAAFLTGIDRLNATPGRRAAAPLRLAAEGAQLRRRAQPARPARRARLEAHGRRPHGRHRPARAPPDAAHAAGHPDHDAGVALPPPHLAGAGDPPRRRDGDRRRGARRRGDEARRASRALAGAARARRRAAVPADRALGDAAAARGDRALRRRRPADRARRRGHPQGARPRGRRRARGHARAGLRPGAQPARRSPTTS